MMAESIHPLMRCHFDLQWVTEQIEEQGLPQEMNPAEANQEAWQIASWVSLALTVILFLFTLIMIKRINIAVGCLKVTKLTVIAS